MASTDLVGTATGLVGGGGGGGPSMFMVLAIVFGIIVFGIGSVFLVYWFVMKMQYKATIVVFKRVDGRFIPIAKEKDKARAIKLGNGGDQIIQLRKHKKMLPFPTIQTGINTYWYFVSDDGEWINFGPGDFDENRREMGAQFLDKEMRYARASLQYMAKERYDQVSFMQKYGGLIAYAILILVTAIGFFLILDKMVDVTAQSSGANVQTTEASLKTMEKVQEVLGALDNICTQSSGSGIRQGGGT